MNFDFRFLFLNKYLNLSVKFKVGQKLSTELVFDNVIDRIMVLVAGFEIGVVDSHLQRVSIAEYLIIVHVEGGGHQLLLNVVVLVENRNGSEDGLFVLSLNQIVNQKLLLNAKGFQV